MSALLSSPLSFILPPVSITLLAIAIMHIRGMAEKPAESFEMFDFAAHTVLSSICAGVELQFVHLQLTSTWMHLHHPKCRASNKEERGY